MSAPLVFIDTETTGLDRRTREIWEVAVIRRDDNGRRKWAAFVHDVNLSFADPKGLEIGRFYERHPAHNHSPSVLVGLREDDVARQVAELLQGAHLVGAVPSFEDTGLFTLLDRYNLLGSGGRAPWHYHLIDVEALAAGYLAGNQDTPHPPWDSEALSRRVGVDPEKFDRHTALGDALWAEAIYDAVMGGAS